MAMVVRFFLRHTDKTVVSDVDIAVPRPEHFDMAAFMQSVKATGFYVGENVFVPYDSIALALYGDEIRFKRPDQDTRPLPVAVPDAVVRPFPTRPAA